uniref:Uncharacterized protein n=1 Tax=Candidatus Kentrum sp. FM TaxID=2126340 RepID=A0A450WYZ9_9GAMM|nr:MAG: hypothetical protein BECKFM1743A_GA0114220_108572 [Candidatus Kentron sp. FM]VFJ75773.1 MAG: hypothetical protein BECKFM1743C_GA0114222_108791 [Candidatus Kentron sp. FM]VFK22248.1 MAG: hypothetical protein BECKFM1743B_GA0114221_108471 [Candidatus Kentron sp. FM]
MSTETRTDLRQLTETVERLGEALAASERRYSSIARAIRWFSLTVIVLVAGAGYAAFGGLGALASQSSSWRDIESQLSQHPPALDGILQSLGATKEIQGAIVKTLQSAATIAAMETDPLLGECLKDTENRLCYSKTKVVDLGEFFLESNGELPTPPGPGSSEQDQQEYNKKLMESTLMAAGQSIVDAAVLLHRIRRDSDRFRQTVDKAGGADKMAHGIAYGIKEELHYLNLALASVPHMVNEMHLMNEHMRVMGYSMGSTMGRMGSMMPW